MTHRITNPLPVSPLAADAAPVATADDEEDGGFDLFEGLFGDDDEEDDDEDDEDSPPKKKKPAAAAVVPAAAPTATPAVPILDVNPTKIAAIINASPEAAAPLADVSSNTIPLDLAHTPALLQLAQTAANEVDTTNLEPIADEKLETANEAIVDVIAESTQQVVNQLSEPVANAKQNEIQADSSSSTATVERGPGDAAAKPEPEEDLLDIVESFISDATSDDSEEEKTPVTSAAPVLAESPSELSAQNDKDETSDDETEDDDDEEVVELLRK